MLKKIFSIFFVICLVFSLTVPCFATVNYVTNIVYPSSYYFVNGHFNYNSTGTSYFCELPFELGHSYYFRYNYISGSHSNNIENMIYASINGTYPNIVPLSRQYETVDRIIACESTPNSSGCICRATATALQFDFLVVDLTAIYGVSVPDLSTVREDLSFFENTTPYNQVNNSIQHPFIEFFSHIFEPFQYITEIGQTGYFFQPLILIGAVVGLLVFIFLCVFLIKRFTGGKT